MKKSDIIPMPDYFDRYIAMADDVPVLDALEIGLNEIDNFRIDQWKAVGDLVYAPGKWTAKDILQHIIDTERIFTYRALSFARNEPQRMLSFDEQQYGTHALANQRTIEDLLAEWRLVRLATIALFRSFMPEMLLQKGKAFSGEYTPLAIGFIIAGHQRWHARIFDEKYLPLLP
jgi:hypothetical protein